MKIDVSKIDGFDGMSADEKIAALMNLEFEEPKAAPDNSDEITKLKNALNKASSDTAEYKRLLREKQTEQERIEQERAEKEAEKDALLQSLMREKNVSSYANELLALGFDKELANNSAEAFADGNTSAIFGNLKTFIENHDKTIKADVLKATPSPVTGNTDKASVSKEQFDKMDYKQRVELFDNNPELYRELNS